MAFDFPNNPANGQIYASPSGPVYRFDDPVWTAVTAADIDGAQPHARAIVSPFDFGGVGNGTTDDTSAIQQAIDYLSTTFQSGTVDMSGGRWLVDSGNVEVKKGVQLVGSWLNVGEQLGGDYSTLKSAVVLNPAYTILLSQDFAGVKGLVVLKKGLITPQSGVRQLQDQVNSFSGIGITAGDSTPGNQTRANDTYVGYCLIIGFNYAYYSDLNERVTIEYLRADCTNGVFIQNCHDMNHLSHCHMWPYLGAHQTFGGEPYSWAVSGAVNNGSGLIRLTIPANVLVTGDVVAVSGVTGATQANGRWTVTVIDATHVDLQGSAFSSAYVSGGALYLLVNARRGTAYNFKAAVDWGQADNCFSWGWDVGFNVEASAHNVLLNCGVDHDAAAGDPTTIGIRVKDCLNAKLIGCKTAAVSTGVLADNDADARVMGIVSHNFWGNNVSGSTGLKIVHGRVNLMGSDINGLSTGIYIDPASTGVHAIGNRANNTTTIISAPAGTGKRASLVQGNDWGGGSAALSGIGNQMAFSNTLRDYAWDEYSDTASPMSLIGRKARGSPTTPAAATTNDSSLQIRGEFWDGVDQFRIGGVFRIQAYGPVTPTSVPTRLYWGAAASGSTTVGDVMVLQYNSLGPAVDNAISLGSTFTRWYDVFAYQLKLVDGVTAPGTVAGHASIYVDAADGDLKIKFGDGTIKTIMVDT